MVRVTLTKIQEYTLQKGCPIPIHKLLYIVDKGGGRVREIFAMIVYGYGILSDWINGTASLRDTSWDDRSP